MHYILRSCFLTLALSSLTACYKDNEEELYPANATCDTTNVTYAKVATLLQTSCLACHSNANSNTIGAGISLEGHSNLSAYITSNQARFIGAIEHTGGYSSMPKGGAKLEACKINQIKKWISNGLQNN